nr:uncharacterized protein LOC112931706 [Vulpes vulpes]
MAVLEEHQLKVPDPQLVMNQMDKYSNPSPIPGHVTAEAQAGEALESSAENSFTPKDQKEHLSLLEDPLSSPGVDLPPCPYPISGFTRRAAGSPNRGAASLRTAVEPRELGAGPQAGGVRSPAAARAPQSPPHGAHNGESWCGGTETTLKDNIQIPWHELSDGRYAKSFKGCLEGSRCLSLCRRPSSNCPVPSSTSSPTTPLSFSELQLHNPAYHHHHPNYPNYTLPGLSTCCLPPVPPHTANYTLPGLSMCCFLFHLCLEDSSFTTPCWTVYSSRKSSLHPSSPSSAPCAPTGGSMAL